MVLLTQAGGGEGRGLAGRSCVQADGWACDAGHGAGDDSEPGWAWAPLVPARPLVRAEALL